MGLEQSINYQLNKHPGIKKFVKKAYQKTMYAISPKTKSEGNIIRVSPDDKNHEYFFGYYDKSPWDATDRYLLCLKANNTWSDVSPKETADIMLIDTSLPESDPDRCKKIAETRSWNVQQSCMLQWLGPDYKTRIIFNDYRDSRYVSVIKTISDGTEQIINAPVYTVSQDGKIALTLDFSRLYNLRPGYGYYNMPEKTKGVALPNATAVWKIDLETGAVEPLLKYTDFALFQPRPEMQEEGAVHKVNHLMLSPNGKRFMVLHRWFCAQRKYTRLVTCNVDGSDMFVLSDDDMVSHCCWMNNSNIFAFENKTKSGSGYYLMKDKTNKYVQYWKGIDFDGHPSFSPDCSKIVFDRYPDKARVASVFVSDSKNRRAADVKTVAKVFAPFKYDNDTRCDLHPRWNRRGDKICFDSVYEGHRGLYVVEVPCMGTEKTYSDRISCEDNTIQNKERIDNITFSIVTPVYNSFELMERYFKSLLHQTYRNFEVILVDDCSTDGSYDKLVNYKESSELNITVLRTEKNGGPGIARNKGMDAACGEWITFIDNDDWVETTMLEELYKTVIDHNVNAVIFDFYRSDGTSKVISGSMYSGETGIVTLSNCMVYARNHTFGKVYKLSKCMEKNIRFPEIRRCEDVAFVCRALEACGSVYYYKKPLYYYYQRSNSLSNNNKMDETDMIKAFSIVEEALASKYPSEMEAKSITDLLYGCTLLMCKAGKSNGEIRRFIREYEDKYPSWYKQEIIKSLGWSKKIFLMAIRRKNIAILKVLSGIHSKIIKG